MIETQDRWKGDRALEVKREWVDFKAVKAAVTIEMVLDHYGVRNLKRVGVELRGPCPIHRGTKTSKHLSINPSKNAFKCFASTCGARGNVLDFVAAMENCPVRDAALKLATWFKVGETPSPEPELQQNIEREVKVRRGFYRDESEKLFEVIATARNTEDSTDLVVYRELFGEFLFWATGPETFTQTKNSEGSKKIPRLTLFKAL